LKENVMLLPLTLPRIGPVFGPLGMLLSVSVPARHSPFCRNVTPYVAVPPL
jgi:hypothetical protein